MTDTARALVLAEYRHRRHAHRPYEAMRAIQNDAASAYAYGAIQQLPPSDEMMTRALARFQVAGDYALEIYSRSRHDDGRIAHAYWLFGGPAYGMGGGAELNGNRARVTS